MIFIEIYKHGLLYLLKPNNYAKKNIIVLIAEELYNCEEAYGEINAIHTDNKYIDVAEKIMKVIINNIK